MNMVYFVQVYGTSLLVLVFGTDLMPMTHVPRIGNLPEKRYWFLARLTWSLFDTDFFLNQFLVQRIGNALSPCRFMLQVF